MKSTSQTNDSRQQQKDGSEEGGKKYPKRNTIGKWTDEDLLDSTPEVRLRNLIFSVILFIVVVVLRCRLMHEECGVRDKVVRFRSLSSSLEHRRFSSPAAAGDVHFHACEHFASAFRLFSSLLPSTPDTEACRLNGKYLRHAKRWLNVGWMDSREGPER